MSPASDLFTDLTGPGKAVSRRGFITSALGTGGALVVGMQLAPGLKFLEQVAGAATAGGPLGVYVTIGADETITLTCPNSEMGQGTSTALPMMVAEELMVDWAQVRLVLGGYDPALNRPTNATTLGTSQSTGGSTAVRGYHDYLRTIGATARQKLIWAANSLNPSIPISDLKADQGKVVQISTGTVVGTYGALAATAVTMTPNDVAWVKPPYRFIGQPMTRLDLGPKVNGSAVFGIDVRLDGMRYASVKQAPKVGQTVGSVGSAPGGAQVVTVPGGVAVITDTSTWTAIQAARQLQVTWVDAPYTSAIDSVAMKARAEGLLATGTALPVSPTVGDANAALTAAPANQRFTGTFSTPFLAHATLEPMNATALVTDTTCEIWAPTQVQTKCVQAAAVITGLPLSAITLHTTYLGGGLGRRLETDYVKQAVTVAMAVKGTPVKLVWSREEDFTHDVYRPCSLAQLDAAVDGSGNVTALKARIVSPSVRAYQGSLAAGTADAAAADGLVNAVYNFPNRSVEWVQDTIQVPVGWWRSIGVSQNCFILETFLDDLATQTNQDPFQLRRNLCNQGTDLHKRTLTVLDRLAADSGWAGAPAFGRARGMSLCVGFGNTIVAMVAEVSGSFGSGFRVNKITAVVDPGTTINPDTVKAQMEGAIHQGLQAALWQQMTFTAGAPNHRNFNTYRMGRMRDYPEVVVTIVESGAPLGGVGEPGVPPVAPAIVNAIAKLTGFRIRSLPVAAQAGPAAPTISTVTPGAATAGTSVVIAGANFTGVTAVKFNGVSATFTVDHAAQITTTVPNSAATGSITVAGPGGTATSPAPFTVSASAPTITSFTPATGAVGTSVVVTGTNLTGATAVLFNGVAATYTVNSSTRITATVPAAAATGSISVTTSGGTVVSATVYTVGIPTTTTTKPPSTTTTKPPSTTTTTAPPSGAPTISTFSPSSGRVGTTVVITGKNFTGATAVKFGGVSTPFTVNSATKITAKVPTGARTGAVSVTTPLGTATTRGSFSVGSPTPAPRRLGD
ncbi:MAG: molybdopterin cofactor-binding domain-containing protein [Actinomycetes bacterium]